MHPSRTIIAARLVVGMAAALAVCAGIAAGEEASEGPFGEAVAYAQDRTVKIVGAGIGREEGFASGIIVSNEGHILTAHGLYLAAERLRVVLPDGSVHLARIERRSPSLPVALLKIDAATPRYFDVPEKPFARPGDWVLAVSNAFRVADGAEPVSVNLGVVSLRTRLDAKRGTQEVPYDGELLLVDAITSNPGAPGGAVVDSRGRLAGMIGKIIESRSIGTRLNYAVPADLLAAFLADKPIEGAPAVAAGVGSNAAEARAELGVRLFTLAGKGGPAFIDRVLAGSPAAVAGLKPDDLVVSLDGRTVPDVREFERLAASVRPGQEVVLIVKRKQEVLRIMLTAATAERGR
jgi:S1-C subfamily serine protease